MHKKSSKIFCNIHYDFETASKSKLTCQLFVIDFHISRTVLSKNLVRGLVVICFTDEHIKTGLAGKGHVLLVGGKEI